MEEGVQGPEDQRGYGFHNGLLWVNHSHRKSTPRPCHPSENLNRPISNKALDPWHAQGDIGIPVPTTRRDHGPIPSTPLQRRRNHSMGHLPVLTRGRRFGNGPSQVFLFPVYPVLLTVRL